MPAVRPLTRDDIPQLTELHAIAFGTGRDPAQLSDFLRDVFFEHPWVDESDPSLAYEDARGRLVGCLGVMPRPMTLEDRSVRCVVTHNFVVSPEARRGLVAMKLLSAFGAGPHTLSLCDGNDTTRTLMKPLGMHVLHAHSSRWIRVLSPLGFGTRLLARKGAGSWLTRMLDVVARAPDAVARRLIGSPFRIRRARGATQPLNAAELNVLLEDTGRGFALRPRYDERSVAWLLSVLAKTRRPQVLRTRKVVDEEGRTVGWFLYYARARDTAKVVQLGGRPEHQDRVLSHLFADAAAQGAVAVSGQVDPTWAPALRRARALFGSGSSWVMAASRDEEVRKAITAGDVLLTRLEGEGWIQLAY